MGYFVVELQDLFQKCLMEKKNQKFLAWEFTHFYNGDIHYSYQRYLITTHFHLSARTKITKAPVLTYTLFYICITYLFI